MIKGLGTDITEIELFKKEWEKYGKASPFLNSVFTEHELNGVTTGHVPPYERLAARYAAKEAFIKAVAPLLKGRKIIKDPPQMKDLEIKNRPDGSPYFDVKGEYAEIIENLEIKQILVSFSHEKHYAVATVITE